MMSSASTQRTGRAPKDRTNKSSQSQTKAPAEGTKPADGIVSKIHPTPEQLRIAQLINDSNKSDPDIKQKVHELMEMTGKTSDAVAIALHDCSYDLASAVLMLVDGDQNEGKWETSVKKKKNRQSTPKTTEVNGHEPAPPEKEEKEPVETTKKRESKPREGSYRYRGPPRMNRGGTSGRNWRNKENEKNERNIQDSKRDRNSEGRSRGPRRSRGRGGRSRTFQNRGLQNDGFPESIDTWTNSTAEKADIGGSGDGTLTVGNWSDIAVTEEWSEEDWNEAVNLTETKVFTPSAGTQAANVGSTLDLPTPGPLGQNIDLASLLQKAGSNSDTSPTPLPTNGMSQQQGQAAMITQQMVSQIPQPVAPQSQSHFDFSQYAKQAAESIKAAVGVGSVPSGQATPSMNANSFQSNSGTYQSNYNISSSNNQHHVQLPHELQQAMVSQSGFVTGSSSVQQPSVQMTHELHPNVVSQQPGSASSAKPTSATQNQPLPARVKTHKTRLPPPSKIPESAVVMPDDAAVASLDVQFGALQFGADTSPFDFTATDNSTYQDIGQGTNASGHVTSQSLSTSISSHTHSNPLPSSQMAKDSTYSMGSHSGASQNCVTKDNQTQKVTGQENMLLSQGEHKSMDNVSAYVNHLTSQSTSLDGSIMNNKPEQSAMNSYNSSSHENASSYTSGPYGTQKSVLNASSLVPSTVSYTHSSSLSSGTNELPSNTQQPSKYQGQVTQSQNSSSYVSGSTSYGMQQAAYSGSTTTSGSSYPSQTGYSSHTSSAYGANSSGYSSQQGYSVPVPASTQSGTMLSTSVTSSKLTNSLPHSVKDSSLLESQHSSAQHSYDVASTTSSSSILSSSSLSSTTTNHSTSSSSNINSVLGLVSTSSSTTTTSVLKNSLSATGKAVPNIPQSVPAMLGHQYIMGQASVPFYGLQQPLYSYEEMQMLQSKLSTMGYYDMQFQAPTSMTGRDPGMGSVAYTADGKYSRAETDASTVATTLSQGQANTQTHGQALFNPAAALPPGYGYYFTGGMMAAGGIHHYAPPLFPVPPATNTHGATTNTQFQKATAYGSHSYGSGYESLTQTQDYSKATYGTTSQNQVKGVSAGSGAVADLSASVYSKAHAQLAKSYDKPGFHTGTPPPFNLAGSQAAGPLGASSAPYAAQFIPVLAHGQHHSQLLHHHMQQDTAQTGGTPATGQRGPQGLGQQKTSSKQNYQYWASN